MSSIITTFEQAILDSNGGSIPQIIGPLFIGTFIDAVFLGVIICQYLYFALRLRRDERLPVRILVFYITLASLGHSIFSQAYGWSVFVAGFGDEVAIVRGWWSKAECVFELMIVMPIEAFYALRTYKLWGRPQILRFCLPALFIASIALGIASISTGAPDPISATTGPLFISWAVSLLVIDWGLSAMIILALIKKRSGIMHSDRLVMRIVILSAEAQLLPSLITLGLVIKAVTGTATLVVLALISVPKVWVICCLLVINNRKSLRRDVEEERQRRQNTLEFLSDQVDGDNGASTKAVAGSSFRAGGISGQTNSAGVMPTLSFTGPPIDDLSDQTDKTRSDFGPQTSASEIQFGSFRSATAMMPIRLSSDSAIGHGLDVSIIASENDDGSLSKTGRTFSMLDGKTGAEGVKGGSIKRGIGDDDEVGDISFEQMLRGF